MEHKNRLALLRQYLEIIEQLPEGTRKHLRQLPLEKQQELLEVWHTELMHEWWRNGMQ